MRARKRFGQHFLEHAWADKVADAVAPHADDRFLEIGPGAGALTLRLAPRVHAITAVEVDRDLAASLAAHRIPNVTVVVGDYLEYDVRPLVEEGPVRVAGNLPYNISSPILFKLLDDYRATGRLIDATVMLQLEVAERLVARPGTGEYGVLGILIGLRADVERRLILPPGAFRPMPKVRSAVVRLSFRGPAVSLKDERLFERTVKTIFSQRRKTVLNGLRPLASALGRDPAGILVEAGIRPDRRPETLDLRELGRLADALT